MLQIILTILIYLLIVLPVGRYMYKVATFKYTFGGRFFDSIDNTIYKISFVDKEKNMGFKQYALSLIGTNFVMMAFGYLIFRIQMLPVFNPNGIDSMASDLSFNTIISFMTNTNLQHYAGENGLSYFSQMLVITFMMFVFAASGYAACVAFIRGITGNAKDGLGNFYVDLVRITTRILLPFSVIGGLLLVWQGVPQNLSGNIIVDTLEGTKQVIATGPVAALEIIKHLGTNGGGFFGANSSTPMENPIIEFDSEDEFLMAKMDARLIVQVIINIVDNAIKYTQVGSKIVIKYYKEDGMVVIYVSDNGDGIKDDVKPKIFDMFYSGSNKVADSHRSLGLGLYLCKSIISAHLGTISICDNYPKGTVFKFTLPLGGENIYEQNNNFGG